jgi:hypothetical protein
MKMLFQGMKNFKKILWSEKVPFGYEKKPVFENFPFHTLGYENFGCFFLMVGTTTLANGTTTTLWAMSTDGGRQVF